MNDQEKIDEFRYPGVTPFSRGQSHIFFGREQETQQLLKLVLRQPLAILYGKSGLGKSSLINAGLIPEIEKNGYYAPLVVRFGAWTASSTASPLDITKDVLKKNYAAATFLSELVPDDNSLWFHAKNRELNGGGHPLLLFDQFEELFSYPEAAVAAFQQEVSELLHTGVPLRFRRQLEALDELSEEEEDRLEAPLETRILLAIRSDKLHLLDRLKDYLPNILRHTYELKALRLDDARAAIQMPAQAAGAFVTPPFTYSESALEKLLDFLKDEETQRVEGILIQMLCEHYERKQVQEKGLDRLDVAQIGDPGQVVKNYYEEKIDALASDDRLTARRLIEEGLVSEGEGMRLSLHEAFIRQEYQVDKSLLEELVKMRLLRAEPFLRGGYTYELSHDRLAPAVMNARAQRREAEAAEEQKREALRLKKQAEQERLEKEKAERQLRTVRGLLGFAIIALALAVAGLIYAFSQRNLAKKQEQEATRLLEENIRKDSLSRIDKFGRFLAEAQSLQGEGKYDQAIARYEFAKEFTNDTAAVNQAIADSRRAADNRSQFDQLMQDAARQSAAGNYSAAIANYREAIGLEVDPAAIRLQLNELRAALSEQAGREIDAAEALSYDPPEAEKYKASARRLNNYVAQIRQLLSSL